MGCMAMIGIAFSSCSNHDLYDEGAVNEKATEQKSEQFASNFIKKYGPIDPNQTWDFTSSTPTFSLPSTGASTRGITRAVSTTKGNMLINQEVIQYFLDNLPKGKNNDSKGTPFTMVTNGNPFTVVPVFQGCASYYWQLWMHIEDSGDILIWSKGDDDFKFRKVGTTDWSKPGTSKDGMNRNMGALEVSAPTYTYNNIAEGKAMYFYLKVWKTYSNLTGYEVYERYQTEPNVKAFKPVISSSLDSWMIDLENATKPTNLPAGNTVTIIGCEDAISGSDKDFEDLVFMVYGNPVPPTKRIEVVEKSTTKRYMIEDLGDTGDFDYNDIVVDVSDRVKVTYIYPNQTATEPTETKTETLPQQAIVRAVGGMLDFTLTIGNKSWTKSSKFNKEDMLNTGYQGETIDKNAELDKFEVSGWNSASNNVSVTVEDRGENDKDKVYTIPFPKAGEAPKIIAVDASLDWMTEKKGVPAKWFKESAD